jgi:2,3-diketo-5-methylthio-1-phosphopentane phosphatase
MYTPLEHLRAKTLSADEGSVRARRVVIFSDFDGTISSQDSLKLLLNRFGGSHWPTIERALATGELPERIGLQRCFDRLQLPFESALRFVLREVKLDPAFRSFANWVQSEGYELSILSGGLENFIQPLLNREGLGRLKLLANRASVRSGVWNISPCQVQRLCDLCNHCKSASLFKEIQKDPNVFLVYVGDGHTDACAIQLADLVFAKSFLKNYCIEKQIPFVGFSSFSEITENLRLKLRTANASQAA